MAGIRFSAIAFFIFSFGLTGFLFTLHSANASTQSPQTLWKFPIPLQKIPQVEQKTNAKEALGAVSCAPCHTKQFKEWNGGRHLNSISFGVMGLLFSKTREDIQRCFKCHAPLYEQVETFHLFRKGRGWVKRPVTIPYGFHAEGVTCSACHVRDHRVYAPSVVRKKTPPAETPYHHKKIIKHKEFSGSDFCRPCHESGQEPHIPDGLPQADTFGQWSKSRYAREGVQCQDCHMPDGRHSFKGSHDPQMIKKGVSFEFHFEPSTKDRAQFTFKVINSGVGHDFPSSQVSRIVMKIRAVDGKGSPMGKPVKENLNAPLAPGEAHTWRGVFEPPENAAAVVATVTMWPDHYYERFFTNYLKPGLHKVEKIMIERAVKLSSKSVYTIFEDRVELQK